MTTHITGIGTANYRRHPEPGTTTAALLADAAHHAVLDAGLSWSDIDGFGVSSFTSGPDRAVDLAWRFGLGRLTWLREDSHGGASALGLVQDAADALASSRAQNILVVAGDCFSGGDFRDLVTNYNSATRDHLSPLPLNGPNSLFALLTQRQMESAGLTKRDYAALVMAQRNLWAAKNPSAVYRSEMTENDYLSAPAVADPLGRFDCVPPVSGAHALVLSSRPAATGGPSVVVSDVVCSYNVDDQDSTGLSTPVRQSFGALQKTVSVDVDDVDVFSLYDDYPAIVVAQLLDLGLATGDTLRSVIRERIATGDLPVNTGGGQLSAGQAGTAGGMLGFVEAATQLRHDAGARQIPEAKTALVTGYGMVLYRYGACGHTALLERED